MATKKTAKKATKAKVKAKTKVTVSKTKAKKPAAKAKPVVKAKAKPAAKAAPKKLGKISKPFTKSELLTNLAERTGLTKKDASSFLEEFENIMGAHLKSSGPGKFVLPGLLNVKVKKVPARPARKGVNPFTGEPTTFKAKPASKKVVIRPLSRAKEMV